MLMIVWCVYKLPLKNNTYFLRTYRVHMAQWYEEVEDCVYNLINKENILFFINVQVK
jgi:hypothetical protein